MFQQPHGCLDIETIEQGAVIEHGMLADPQGVARDLPFSHREVAGAFASDGDPSGGKGVTQRVERTGVEAFHAGRSLREGRNHRPHQAARPEYHRGPAGGPPHHPHPSRSAGLHVDLILETAGGADDDGELRGHPGADGAVQSQATLGLVQQGFVDREVLFDSDLWARQPLCLHGGGVQTFWGRRA